MSAPSTSDTEHGPTAQRLLPWPASLQGRRRLVAACAASAAAGANTSNGYNLPPGVTQMSRDIYDLHMEAFWICVGIAIVVFGAMIYALVKFRASQGAVPDTTMVHSTKVEIIWTIVPVVILVVMAIPAAELILKMEDMRNSELSIRVTGYQWKWEYQYMDAGDGIDFFSTLKQDSNFARELHSGIDPKYGAELSARRRPSLGRSERHQGARHPHLGRCDPRLVRARFRPEALGQSRASSTSCGSRSTRARKGSTAASARRFAAATTDSCPWWSTFELPTISRSGSRSKRRSSSRRPPRRPMRRRRRAGRRHAPLRPSTELKTF